MRIRSFLLLLSGMFLLLIPSFAFAEPDKGLIGADPLQRAIPKYNMEFWRPAPNPGDYLTTYGAMIESKDKVRLTGGFYMNYAHTVFDMKYGTQKSEPSVLYNQMFMDIYLSMSVMGWFELALNMPFGLHERTDFTDESFPLRNVNRASGVGDLRIVAKGKILDLKDYPVGLALVADLSVPTGSKKIFMSDEAVTFVALAVLEFNPWKLWRFSFNLGYRYRPRQDIYGFVSGQTLIISGAAAVPFFHPDLDFIADFKGELTVERNNKMLDSEERPFEADFGFRFRFLHGETEWYRGLALTAGVGTGLDSIGTPDIRVFLGLNFHWVNGGVLSYDFQAGGYLTPVEPCPDPELTPLSQIPERCRNVTIDSDGDTVPDNVDKCPFTGRVGYIDAYGCPSDRDGDTVPDYEDLCPDEGGRVDVHGCPIPEPKDTDGDTILDNVDQCPLVPETFNGYEDEDGCPDTDPNALVSLSSGKIDIKQQVFFETAKAIIKPESYELLNQVAGLLNDNPQIGNISIEGHTDSRGRHKKNIKLSQDRAESVMKYLVEHGVDEGRLSAIGYGPDRPIDSNKTEEGRARNRRVEFIITGIPDKN